MSYEFAPLREDADLNPAALALPAAGAGTVNSASIDLNAVDPLLAEIELEVGAPALGATALPNAETMKYTIQDSADDTTFVSLSENVLTQTGAGGVGAAAATARAKLPSNVSRYVRLSATSSAGAGNASGSNMTLGVKLP